MIIINTDTMTEIAGKAKIANTSVEEAIELLNRVALHYDWVCKEKTAINDYTIKNKAEIRKLHDVTEHYLAVAVQASMDFKNAELNICNSFNDLDLVIGKGVAGIGSIIEKNKNICPIFIDLKEIIKSDINFGSAISNFQAANIGESIQIAEFKNILLDK